MAPNRSDLGGRASYATFASEDDEAGKQERNFGGRAALVVWLMAVAGLAVYMVASSPVASSQDAVLDVADVADVPKSAGDARRRAVEQGAATPDVVIGGLEFDRGTSSEAVVCANELEDCKCFGTVYYGRRYTDSGAITTFNQMITEYHGTQGTGNWYNGGDQGRGFSSRISAGNSKCSYALFGDPFPGVEKHCYCLSYGGECANGVLERTSFRVADNECASCDGGYYLTGTRCNAFMGSCLNGKLAPQSERTSDDDCGSCDPGYYVHLDPSPDEDEWWPGHDHPQVIATLPVWEQVPSCKPYGGVCRHGTLAPQAERRNWDVCGSCDAGYFLVAGSANQTEPPTCEPFAGECANGDLAAQEERTKHGHCGACDAGYYLEGSDCVGFAGKCADGQLAAQEVRTGDDHCGACDAGFVLVGSRCEPWGGECLNGALLPQGERTKQDQCGECDAGYYMGHAYLGCVEVDPVAAAEAGWRMAATAGNLAEAVAMCAGAVQIAADCPTGEGATIWCNDGPASSDAVVLRQLPDGECSGSPQDASLNEGSNGHCIGPYLLGSGSEKMIGGGWHRGALYSAEQTCLPLGGACEFGQLRPQRERTFDDECGACNDGYYLGDGFGEVRSGKFVGAHLDLRVVLSVTECKTWCMIDAACQAIMYKESSGKCTSYGLQMAPEDIVPSTDGAVVANRDDSAYGLCVAYGGECANGELIAQALRLQDGHCGECEAGHYLLNNECVAFGGTCVDGQLPEQALRTREDECGACDGGFTLTASDADISTCVPFEGACENGRLKDVADRTADNECGACDAGYELQGSDCVVLEGECANGRLRELEDRTAANQCGECDGGHYLQASECSDKVQFWEDDTPNSCEEFCALDEGSHCAIDGQTAYGMGAADDVCCCCGGGVVEYTCEPYEGNCDDGELRAQGERTAHDQCGECDEGYYLSGPECLPWGGYCDDGELRAQGDRTAHDQCGECDEGYYLDGAVCKDFDATCDNGVVAASRTRDNECAECDAGYYLEGTDCLPFSGLCENGELKRQQSRVVPNDCGRCDPGYYLEDSCAMPGASRHSRRRLHAHDLNGCTSVCVPFEGRCENGQLTETVMDRYMEDQCGSCDPGYYLSAARCLPWGGECASGYLIAVLEERTAQNQCGACEEGFELSNFACSQCEPGFHHAGGMLPVGHTLTVTSAFPATSSGSCSANEIDGTYTMQADQVNSKVYWLRTDEALADSPMYLRWAPQWTQWIFDNDLEDRTSTAWLPADLESTAPSFEAEQPGWKEGSNCQNGVGIVVNMEPSEEAPNQQCVEWGGECANGELIALELRTQDNHCGTCQAGAFLSGGTECVLYAGECPNGQLAPEPYRVHHDQCGACNAGYELVNQRCSPCGAGSFQAEDATIVECELCAPGQFQDKIGMPSCEPAHPGHVALGEGAVECGACAQEGTVPSEDQAECELCPVGQFARRGDTTCTACSVGYFAEEPGSSECDECGPGSYQDSEGQNECYPCAAGTYEGSRGSTECTECPIGLVSESGQVACHGCVAGTFSDAAGMSECTKCDLGKYVGADGEMGCLDCPEGTVARDEGLSECEACQRGSKQVDNECVSCAAGTFQAFAGRTDCIACFEGMYAADEGAFHCAKCAPGTVQPDPASSACRSCDEGTFQISSGQTVCALCAVGKAADIAGMSACTACTAGQAQANEGAVACERCERGTAQRKDGQASCDGCEAGTVAPDEGSSECVACTAGSAQPLEGQQSCESCTAGRHQMIEGQSECELCEPGTFAAGDGAMECGDCAVGQMMGDYGALECVDCAAGSVQASVGMTECDLCGTGTFMADEGQEECVTCQGGCDVRMRHSVRFVAISSSHPEAEQAEYEWPLKANATEAPSAEELADEAAEIEREAIEAMSEEGRRRAAVRYTEVDNQGTIEEAEAAAEQVLVADSDHECSMECMYLTNCTAWARQPSTGKCWLFSNAIEGAVVEPNPDRNFGMRCDNERRGYGTWTDQEGSTACVDWSNCEAGTHINEYGTKHTDRTCVACEPETWNNQANVDACRTWSSCSGSDTDATVEQRGVTIAGTAKTDVVCEECEAGKVTIIDDSYSPCQPLEDADGDGMYDRFAYSDLRGMGERARDEGRQPYDPLADFDKKAGPTADTFYDRCPFDSDNDADGDGICANATQAYAKAYVQNEAYYAAGGAREDLCPFDSDNDLDKDLVCDDDDAEVISWDFLSNSLVGWEAEDAFAVVSSSSTGELPHYHCHTLQFDTRLTQMCPPDEDAEEDAVTFSMLQDHEPFTCAGVCAEFAMKCRAASKPHPNPETAHNIPGCEDQHAMEPMFCNGEAFEMVCRCVADPDPIKTQHWSQHDLCPTCFASTAKDDAATGVMRTEFRVQKNTMRFNVAGRTLGEKKFVKLSVKDNTKVSRKKQTEDATFIMEATSNFDDGVWYPVEWDLSKYVGETVVLEVEDNDGGGSISVDDFTFVNDRNFGCLPSCMAIDPDVCDNGETCFFFEHDKVPYVKRKSTGENSGVFCRDSTGLSGSMLGKGIVQMADHAGKPSTMQYLGAGRLPRCLHVDMVGSYLAIKIEMSALGEVNKDRRSFAYADASDRFNAPNVHCVWPTLQPRCMDYVKPLTAFKEVGNLACRADVYPETCFDQCFKLHCQDSDQGEVCGKQEAFLDCTHCCENNENVISGCFRRRRLGASLSSVSAAAAASAKSQKDGTGFFVDTAPPTQIECAQHCLNTVGCYAFSIANGICSVSGKCDNRMKNDPGFDRRTWWVWRDLTAVQLGKKDAEPQVTKTGEVAPPGMHRKWGKRKAAVNPQPKVGEAQGDI